jgi:hypothetical protein
MSDIAALFVEAKGIYSTLPGVDVWDFGRDARDYAGPHPVVAHPPCQLWGAFAEINFHRWGGEHNRPGNDGGCFASALASVRKYGGVLEHPAGSKAWPKYCLQKPVFGVWQQVGPLQGWVTEVWQSAYGHKARKRTWLLYSGDRPPLECDWRRLPGTHQCGYHDQRGVRKNKPTLGKREASATPITFAKFLVRLARHSKAA